MLEHKHCGTVTFDPITESATKCLMGGQHIRHGYAGQREDACPAQDRARFHHATQKGAHFQTYELFIELFISGIFHFIFPDLS